MKNSSPARVGIAAFVIVLTVGLSDDTLVGFLLLHPTRASAEVSAPPSDKQKTVTLRAYYLYAFEECGFEPVDNWRRDLSVTLDLPIFTNEELAGIEPDAEPEDMFAHVIEFRRSRARACFLIRAKFGVGWATPRLES
jgi:hypothetical protein